MRHRLVVVAFALVTCACGGPTTSPESDPRATEYALIPSPQATASCAVSFPGENQQLNCLGKVEGGVAPYQYWWQYLITRNGVEEPYGWFQGSTTFSIPCDNGLYPDAEYFFIKFQYKVVDANTYESNTVTSRTFRCVD
ncbi:hypothetical protein [Corallococcus silvisoli]|uniref:hypothetical protein n=1 Tax=Corallococcus silvisoli TaxID=2697031 RepID=UPI0013789791|nr:hypothetical protein [Corallococcus silvisoli]NBD08358.1 hypothetical protein [Corallococcus silvisoli]